MLYHSFVSKFAVVLLTAMLPVGLLGQTLFNQSYTGQQLLQADGGDTTFNVATTDLGGGTIELDPSANDQVLFSWDLLPAGTRGGLVIDVTVDYTPATSDNDPIFLMSDATQAVGIVRLDSGVVHAQKYNPSGTSLNSRTETSNIITGLGSVEPFSFQILLEDASIASSLTDYTEGSASTPNPTSISYSHALDTDQALTFLMASSSVASSELYQLNSVSISVSAVPEQSSFALIVGLACIPYMLRHRRCGR